MAYITSVRKGSIAHKNKIQKDEELLSVNGNPVKDVLDYMFYTANERVDLLIAGKDGNKRTVHIKKDEYEDIGLEFESFLMDKQTSCKNKCIFCFIDQLPKGLRQSLYFKDDDVRLSFLMGNYI